MDTNYDEWSDTAIAFEVMCRHLNPTEKKIEKGVAMYRTHEEEKWHEFNIDNPAHVWHIIAGKKIGVMPAIVRSQRDKGFWIASENWSRLSPFDSRSEKPLRAASICFLKLTDATND